MIARVEVGAQGPDTRFIVTNLQQRNARRLYEDVYCPRGQAENHIKSWNTDLAADRTSCTKASASQLRLFLHAVRLLDHVGPARVDAEAFDVACGAVRHLAPAPDQNCRTRRRDEDDDPRAPADIVSGATHFPLCARTNPASRNPALRHLTGGRDTPISQPFPINPKTSASPNAGQPLAMQKRVRQTI